MTFRFRNSIPKLLLSLAIVTAQTSLPAQSKDETRLLRRTEKIAQSIRNIQADEISKIPESVMAQAKGVIILKQYEAGVIVGAKGGFGLAMRRDKEGNWGSPAWIKTGEISGGIQIGAQTLNVVLVIVKDSGLRMLDKAKFQIGVDASVTRGPTGSNYEARLGDMADILAYTDYEGFYAGATFEGGFLLPDRKSNELTYGQKREVSDIINGNPAETPELLAEIVKLIEQIGAPDLSD